MTDIDSTSSTTTEPAGAVSTAINILTSPAEAFRELEQRPTKLFPILAIVLSTCAAMLWYYSIVDFDWFIDDVLSQSNIPDDQMEQAREQMTSMSQTSFRIFGILGSSIFFIVLWVLQAGYLSMVSALSGDRFKFTNWFSLVVWAALPSLLAIIGMGVTIALSPNGQLSAFDLNPLTLRNLGMESSNASIQSLFAQLDLTILWGIGLMVAAYQQWLKSTWIKACSVVLAPYLFIIGVWAYFALT